MTSNGVRPARTRWLWVFAIAACGAEPSPVGAPTCWQEQGQARATSPAWTEVSDGATAIIQTPSGTAALTLRAFDPAGAPACVQLVQLQDSSGINWVAPTAGESYCRGCLQRVSLGVGYGLFVLPTNDQPPPFAGPLTVQATATDCAASTSAARGLRVQALFRPEVPPAQKGVLPVGLAFDRASPLGDDTRRNAVVPEALRLLNQMLAPGALSVAVVRTRLFDGPHPLTLTRGDPDALDRLYGQLRGDETCARPDEDGWIPLVFAGCILIDDPDLQTSYQPDGLTPGIPGGFPPPGRAHGIYLKGRSCRPGGDPIDWPASLLAKLIAHELGHYLGLYHTVEADGTEDQLEDTNAANIMFAQPLNEAAQGFSAAQFRVMRRHPAVRWQ
jgi:hypothetical protein